MLSAVMCCKKMDWKGYYFIKTHYLCVGIPQTVNDAGFCSVVGVV